MNKLRILALLTIFLLGAAAVQAQDTGRNVAITLERGPCFGACPIYTLTLYEDGTVAYAGERFVTVTGEQTSQIDPETVQAMVDAFAEAGYFDWDEAYQEATVTDLPTVTTSVTRDGQTHQIVRYAGDPNAPLALPFLEQWIDEMTGSGQWTGVEPNYAALTFDRTPLATLYRTACFGMCPVYSVALFEDGTVVYTGIANVERIGVHVLQMDAPAIASIGPRAESLGYFTWEDSYEDQVITDQSTIITSVQWEDQYKRIVRYLGDPGAPVGLAWVEEIIAQTVADLVG